MRRIYEDRAYGPEPAAGCYWSATVAAPDDLPAASGDLTCDFAVVGGGYAGLSAALELAEAGADVAVFDAAHPGWGASGRNGGFCCEGGSKLSNAALDRAFGAAERALFRRAQRAAIDEVAGNLDRYGIDAERGPEGETLLAHRPRDAVRLPEIAQQYRDAFGLDPEVIARAALAGRGLAGPNFHGALITPLGFALNPAFYAAGLARAAKQAGVRLFARSEITGARPGPVGWALTTAQATIRTGKVLFATNGYSDDDLPRWMAARYLPVQSNIMVTRPLSADELAAQGYTSHGMAYDSRKLLHYFRLLPDNRFLFGMRGAVSASAAAEAAMRARMRADFAAMFPAWAGVQATHFWSGLACLSRPGTPFAGPVPGAPGAFAAFAYHGNGVSMAGYCGRLIAEAALGRTSNRPAPAFFAAPPARFPLGHWRRALLRLAYGWYQLRDL